MEVIITHHLLSLESREAVQRRSAAFGRIVEVDDRLASHEFADCDYCEEGWFGTTQSPPGGCCATYEKMNFILAPKERWLHPERSICLSCLGEVEGEERAAAKAAAKANPEALHSAPPLHPASPFHANYI